MAQVQRSLAERERLTAEFKLVASNRMWLAFDEVAYSIEVDQDWLDYIDQDKPITVEDLRDRIIEGTYIDWFAERGRQDLWAAGPVGRLRILLESWGTSAKLAYRRLRIRLSVRRKGRQAPPAPPVHDSDDAG